MVTRVSSGRRAYIALGIVLASIASVAFAATFNLFSPANGVLKGDPSTYVTTAAVSSDIRGLWTGTCDASTFLRGDGACASVATSPAGSDTQVQYNNAGAFGASSAFTWNGGSSLLNLGTSTVPGTYSVGTYSAMTISGAAMSVPFFAGNSNTQGNLELHSYTSASPAAGSFMYGIRARNTLASPAAVANGDNLLTLGGAGFDGTNYTWGAHIHFLADGTPSAGVLPGALDFQTTPAASNTPTSRLFLSSAGAFRVNGSNGTAGNVLVSGGTGATAWGSVVSTFTGTCNSTTFLRGDGSCQSPGGGGTVTSITAGTGISASPSSPITSSGTLSVDQAFSPTWTGTQTFVGAGSTLLRNSTDEQIRMGGSGAGANPFASFYNTSGVRVGYLQALPGTNNVLIANEMSGGPITLSTTGGGIAALPAGSTVGGTNVCLSSGTNCPAVASSATATYTAVGLTTSPTTTVRWTKIGNIALMSIGAGLTGTSNSTLFTATGTIPAGFQPVRIQNCTLLGVDNGNNVVVGVTIQNGTSTLAFFNNTTSGFTWTNSGTKALGNSPSGQTCAYALD